MLVILAVVILTHAVSAENNLLSAIAESVTIKPLNDFVIEKGYPFKEEIIETDDGFKLTIHRVSNGRNWRGGPLGHPVLLAHGILQSSALYLTMENGLAFLLADAGFDVWLLNTRGNRYSRNHETYSPLSKDFWNFSFHEMGKYDLPAAIDHILKETGRPTLSYVGFSMGNAMFWVLADSWGAKYMDKVDTMVAMAPIARPSRMLFLQNKNIHTALHSVLKFYNFMGFYEMKPFNPTAALLIKLLCSNGESSMFCTKMLSSLFGLFPDSIQYTDTYVSTQYMPAGTSVKTLEHFIQIGEKKSFKQFDYEEENKNHYNPPAPPRYDLKKVTCPVFFVASESDQFSVEEDVEWLAEQLPAKPPRLFSDTVKGFRHLDYFYSKNVKKAFYEPLVAFLKERRVQLDGFQKVGVDD